MEGEKMSDPGSEVGPDFLICDQGYGNARAMCVWKRSTIIKVKNCNIRLENAVLGLWPIVEFKTSRGPYSEKL